MLRVVRSGRWAERKHDRLRLDQRRRTVQQAWPLALGGGTSEHGGPWESPWEAPWEAEAALALILQGARLELEVAVRAGQG